MDLTTAQKKRLTHIGTILIDAGFSDTLVRAGLLPKIGFLDRIKVHALSSGPCEERLTTALKQLGTTGVAFAHFAAHRPDLFAPHFRKALAGLAAQSRNSYPSLESDKAQKLLLRVASREKFDDIPFLVTPFASYYQGKEGVATIFHKKILSEIHFDVELIHSIIAQNPHQHSYELEVLGEFADYVSDFYDRSSDGAYTKIADGASVEDIKSHLKEDVGAARARELAAHWFESVFASRSLAYDLSLWRSTKKGIAAIDTHPRITLTIKEAKVLLTFFTSLHVGDEKTAAVTLLNMCSRSGEDLEHAERLVSHACHEDVHIFEAGITILESASAEEMHLAAHYAQIAGSGSQLISLVHKYAPRDTTAFDALEQHMAKHHINLQREAASAAALEHVSQNTTSEVSMKENPTHTDAAIERLAKEIDKSSNRIAYSAIIAAFTIAGALLIANASQVGIVMLGVPFFVIAFFTALMLIASIIKEPR